MRWVVGLFMAAALLLGFGVLLLPPDYYPYLVGGAVFVIVAFLSLARPILLLYFIILSSIAAEGIRSFETLGVGQSEVSLSGVRWAFLGAVTAFAILANIRKISLPWPFVGLAVFCFWVSFRWATTAHNTLGLKEVGIYGLPIFIGLYAVVAAFQGGESLINRTESFYLFTILIPLVLYAIYIPLGLTPWTEAGPKGFTNPRVIADYLLVVLAASLAMWRHGRNSLWSRRGLVLSLIAVGTILFTLSRTAAVAALIIIGLSRVNPRRLWTVAPRALLGVILGVGLLVAGPVYRQRSFFRTGGSLSQDIAYFNTSGRKTLWPFVLKNAMQKPVLGWGPGSAKTLLAQVYRPGAEVFQPHNEYLGVFHDTGLVGLILMLFAWGWLVLLLWRNWAQAQLAGDTFRARWNLAAFLGLAAVLLTAVADNTLHYPEVFGPAFILVAFAHYANQRSSARGGRPGLAPGVRSGNGYTWQGSHAR